MFVSQGNGAVWMSIGGRMVCPAFIYRLTTRIFWVVAAAGKQNLLGVSETPGALHRVIN